MERPKVLAESRASRWRSDAVVGLINAVVIVPDGPYDFTLCLTGSVAGSPPRLTPLILNAHLSAPELPAYSCVLMDVLNGDSTLSIRGDEAEQAWRVLIPVL